MGDTVISVIIPTLNEAENLRATVEAASRSNASREFIIVDAGSTDSTVETALHLRLGVCECEHRQRAAQMNLGASRSRGDILLFLHADTILPVRALDRVEAALSRAKIGGGGFARRFDSESVLLRVTCGLAEIRNRLIGWHLGDQAMFARKELFAELDGFRLMDRFEDLDFSRRLSRITKAVTLRPPVISSARRFKLRGALPTTMRDFALTMRYLMGDSAVTRKDTPAQAREEHAR